VICLALVSFTVGAIGGYLIADALTNRALHKDNSDAR
jgi:uncharacterized protein YneF (UPF0154 family)